MLETLISRLDFRKTRDFNMEWAETLQTLAAVVVGGLLATLGSFAERQWERARNRKGVAAAISAEIASILSIAERRGHEAHFQAHLDNWRAGKQLDKHPGIYGAEHFVARGDPIFDANAVKIGELGPGLSEDVTRFYAALRGIRDDIAELSTERVQAVEARIAIVEDDLALWQETKQLGEDLIVRLRTV